MMVLIWAISKAYCLGVKSKVLNKANSMTPFTGGGNPQISTIDFLDSQTDIRPVVAKGDGGVEGWNGRLGLVDANYYI